MILECSMLLIDFKVPIFNEMSLLNIWFLDALVGISHKIISISSRLIAIV